MDNLNPDFVTKFMMDYTFHQVQKLKFELWVTGNIQLYINIINAIEYHALIEEATAFIWHPKVSRLYKMM